MLVKIAKVLAVIAILLGFAEWWLAHNNYDVAAHFDLPELTPQEIWVNPSRAQVEAPRKQRILVIGCSFTAAGNVLPQNNYVWNLNELFPNSSFDNGAVDGAGPVRCLQHLSLALQVQKYDAVIYACIGHHYLRDLSRELEMVPSPDGKGKMLSKIPWYKVIKDDNGEGNVVLLPRESIVWFGDDHLRLINFAKCFTYDAWYRWQNRQVHRLQLGKGEAEYDDEYLMERFSIIVRQMQRLSNESGAKFGVVELDPLETQDRVHELFVTHSQDLPPYLDAHFPLDTVPHVLINAPGPCNDNHPNVDVYRYYTMKIARWLIDEGFVPQDTVINANDWLQTSEIDLFSPEPQPITEYLFTVPPAPFEPRQLHRQRDQLGEALVAVIREVKANPQPQDKRPLKHELDVLDLASGLCYDNCNCPRAMLRRYIKTNVLPIGEQLESAANWPKVMAAWQSYEALAPYEKKEEDEDIYYWAQYLAYCSNLLGIECSGNGSSVLFKLNRELLFFCESIVHRRLRQPIEDSSDRLNRLIRKSRNVLGEDMFVLDEIERARDNVLRLLPTLPNGGLPMRVQAELVDVSQIKDTDNGSPSSQPELGHQVWLPLGVNYTVESLGKGASARAGDVCGVRLRGYFTDGTAFEDNYEREEPMRIPLGGGYYVHGFEMAVTGMKVGEKRHIFIPYYMAYNEAGWRNIPGRTNLLYDVELVSLERYKR